MAPLAEVVNLALEAYVRYTPDRSRGKQHWEDEGEVVKKVMGAASPPSKENAA